MPRFARPVLRAMRHYTGAREECETQGVTPTRSVLISGPLGSGKTAVAIAAGELLDEVRVPNAVIDLDWLCWAGPSLSSEQLLALMCDNLESLRERYVLVGIQSLILCRAVTTRHEVESLRRAAGGALVAMRLSVPADERTKRLRARANPAELAEAPAVDEAQVGLHLPALRNHGRDARDTAGDLLRRVHWLS